MKDWLRGLAERWNDWRQRRAFARLALEYRRVFTALGIAPKEKCGLHTGSLLDCQHDIKGSCTFHPGKGVKCASMRTRQ